MRHSVSILMNAPEFSKISRPPEARPCSGWLGKALRRSLSVFGFCAGQAAFLFSRISAEPGFCIRLR